MAPRRKHGGRQRRYASTLGFFFFFNTQRLISDTSTANSPFHFVSLLHLTGETLHTTHTKYNITITCMNREEIPRINIKNREDNSHYQSSTWLGLGVCFLFLFPTFPVFVSPLSMKEKIYSDHAVSAIFDLRTSLQISILSFLPLG
jgi:hypothetical protein